MSNVQGDVGVRVTLKDDLERGVSRVNQSLESLAKTVERIGAQIDKAMEQAASGAQQTSRATKELTEEQKQAAEAARKHKEEQKRLREEQRKAAEEARKQKQALQDLREGLSQVAIATGLVTAALVAVSKAAVDAYNQQVSAFRGLEAVAQRTTGSFTKAKKAAEALAADGLMSIAEASKAVQAGLATGFDLEQTVKLIEAFKDSAAFNRQAGLEFGEAVVRAMEGVRMGNSILADAAGITKNLSVILKEMGYSEQDLQRVQSDLNVRMALYNGILKEAALYQGNAAKAANELAGAQARAGTQAFKTKAAFGEALAPVVQILAESFTELMRKIGAFIDANPDLARAAVLIVGGITAVTTAVGALTVAWLNLNRAILSNPIGLAVMGISALVGTLGGMIVSTEAAVRAKNQLRSETSQLMREYDALRRVLDDATTSTDDKERAAQRLKDTLAKLFELQPHMQSWFDEEGRLLDEATDKWNKYRDAVVNAEKVQARQRLQDTQKALDDKRRELADKEQELRDRLEAPIRRTYNELVSTRGKEFADEWRKPFQEQIDDQIALAIGDLEREIAILEAELAKDAAYLEALSEPLPKENVLPPPPTEDPPPDGGGQGKMSPALAAALEDLQDLQALEKSPDTLRRILEKVRQILAEHGAELKELGRDRDLIRMRDIILPRDIQEAEFTAALQAFQREEAEAAAAGKPLPPEVIRSRLEAIQKQFEEYLEAHPEAASTLRIRIAGATAEEVRQPLENWRRSYEQNVQMGLFQGRGGQQLQLQSLRSGLALALSAGDMDAVANLVGQIRRLEAALQDARFEEKFKAIQEAREEAFSGAAVELANLEKELIDAQAAGDAAKAADLKQRMLDLVRPALEAQEQALEALLTEINKSKLLTEEQKAEQREQVERELTRVREELYAQDVEAHRLAAEAKEAAESRQAERRQQLIQRQMTWIQMLADADIDAMRRRQEAAERAKEARIKALQDELDALERLWAAEDRRNRIQDLRDELEAVKADTRFQKVLADGSVVYTYDEARARELEKQLADAEREDERARIRERLQDQIRAAQDELAAMRDRHQRALDARQQFWNDIQGLDLTQYEDLVKAAEEGLGEWSGVFGTHFDDIKRRAEEMSADVIEAVNRMYEAMSGVQTGNLGITAPTLPETLSSSISSSVVVNVTNPVTLHGSTDSREAAAVVQKAAAQGTEQGVVEALTRSGRLHIRMR